MTLSVDRLISRAWGLYKSHWRHLVPVTAAVYVVVGLLSTVFLESIGRSSVVPTTALTVAGFYLVQGPATIAVVDVMDGRADLSPGATIAQGFGAWRALVPAALVAGAVIAVGLVILIPGLILLTIWVAVGSVAVMENHRGVFHVLGRSRDLVRGHGWQVFFVIAAVALLGFLTAAVLVALFSLLGFPFGAVQLFSQLVAALLIVPLFAICSALVYLGLREAKGEPVSSADLSSQADDEASPA